MAKSTSVDALFFAAHADDIELACGGTIAKLVSDGRRAGIVDLTRGEMGTRGTPEIRLRESRAAARILGATFREQFDFGDGGLRTGRDEEMHIIEIVRRWRPSIIFAPWPDERHPDHTRSGRLVAEASFYAGLRKIQTKLPAHRPQAVVYYVQNYLPPLSFVMDVTESWETKMKAINCYKSQFFDRKSKEPRTFIAEEKFLEIIDARGKHFGALIGARYGEAYVTKQPPRIDDVFGAYRDREV
jgi:bacillithiol biosynthesis deacetylase BshB1